MRKGQVEGDGFTRQVKAIQEYAAAHDMKIVNVYREKGVSGTKESSDRPAWSELMTALHANGVKTDSVEMRPPYRSVRAIPGPRFPHLINAPIA